MCLLRRRLMNIYELSVLSGAGMFVCIIYIACIHVWHY